MANGLATIVDAFITKFMPLEKYEEWRKKEYGVHCGTVEQANQMTLAQALFNLSLSNDDKEICDNLRECGLLAINKCVDDEEVEICN